MEKNEFIPPGIPLLSDYSLLKTVVEYRHILSILKEDRSSSSKRIREQVHCALQIIEDELLARDLRQQVTETKQTDDRSATRNISGAYAG